MPAYINAELGNGGGCMVYILSDSHLAAYVLLTLRGCISKGGRVMKFNDVQLLRRCE